MTDEKLMEKMNFELERITKTLSLFIDEKNLDLTNARLSIMEFWINEMKKRTNFSEEISNKIKKLLEVSK